MTVLANSKVAINSSSPDAMLTVEGGIRTIKLGADPCGNTADYPEATIFYNKPSHFYCFCNDSAVAVKVADESKPCF